MKKLLILFFTMSLTGLFAQDTNYVDPNYKPPKERKAKKPGSSFKDRVYYGGTFGLTFGSDYTAVLVEPLVGFKMTEKLSTGVGIGVRYGQDRRFNQKVEFTNYIGRVFSRYLITQKFYGHMEFMGESYDDVFYFESEPDHRGRTLVPFLFVGGGIRSPAGRGSFIFQVLFNVLNDPKSREVYPSGFPFLSIGYIGGF